MTSRKTRGESRAGAEEHEVSLVAGFARGGTLRASRQREKGRFEANRLMCPWNSGISFRSMALDAVPSGGKDDLPRDFRTAESTPDLRPRIPGRGTDDHSDAWVPRQPAPLDRMLLISRHRVESLFLIFSGGVLRTNPPGYPYTASNQVGDLDCRHHPTAPSASNPRRARCLWSACH